MAEYNNQRKPQIEEFQYQLVYRSPWLRLFNQDWQEDFRRSISFTAPGELYTNAGVDKPADAEALEIGPTFTKASLGDGTAITRELVRGFGSYNPMLEREQLGGASIRQHLMDAVATKMSTGVGITDSTGPGAEDADAIDPRIRGMVTKAANFTGNNNTIGPLGTDGTVFIAPPSGNSPPVVTSSSTKDARELVRDGVAQGMYLLRDRKIAGAGIEAKLGAGAPSAWTYVIPHGLQWVLWEWLASGNDRQFITRETMERAAVDLGIRGSDSFAGTFSAFGVDVMVDLNLPDATSSTEWKSYLVPGGSRALWAGVEITDFVTTGPEDDSTHARLYKMSSVGRLSAAVLRPEHIVEITIKQN